MATRTQAQLATRVGHKLGILHAAGTLSAEDQAYILAEYADVLQELKDQGLAYWTADEIPQELFNTLVKLVGNECAPAFGKAMDANIILLAQKDLRRHMAKPRSGEPTRASHI